MIKLGKTNHSKKKYEKELYKNYNEKHSFKTILFFSFPWRAKKCIDNFFHEILIKKIPGNKIYYIDDTNHVEFFHLNDVFVKE